MLTKIIFFILFLTSLVFAAPPNDKAIFDLNDPEGRIHKKRRPCRGRSNDSQGRFFLPPWSLQYVDVNYNYNYNNNINCGGGGGGHGGGLPIGGGGSHGGGGNYGGGPQKPILSGLLQGVGSQLADNGGISGVLSGPVSFVQSQVQGIFANGQGPSTGQHQDGLLGSIGNGIGSLFQGGLFNGQGISSLFENGLFSGIFDSGPSNSPSNSPSSGPSAPNRPILTTTYRPPTTTQDPDDIIYNDEKPVHEDHDDVFPDNYNRPGQYLVASNPLFGQHTFDLSGGGSNYRRAMRQFNREINRFLKPFESLFGI